MSLIPNLDSLYETVGNKVDGDILYAEVINRFDTSNVNVSKYVNMIKDTLFVSDNDTDVINKIKGLS